MSAYTQTAIHEQFFFLLNTFHINTPNRTKTINDQTEQNVSCFVNISCTRAMYSFARSIWTSVMQLCVCVCLYVVFFLLWFASVCCILFRTSIYLTQLWNALRFLQPDKFSDDIKMSLYIVFFRRYLIWRHFFIDATTITTMKTAFAQKRCKSSIECVLWISILCLASVFLCVTTLKNAFIGWAECNWFVFNVENVRCSTQSINHNDFTQKPLCTKISWNNWQFLAANPTFF